MRYWDLLVLGALKANVVVSGRDVKPVFAEVERIVDDARLPLSGSGAILACGAARPGLSVGYGSEQRRGAHLRRFGRTATFASDALSYLTRTPDEHVGKTRRPSKTISLVLATSRLSSTPAGVRPNVRPGK
jgi:hypothetical protein